MYYKVMKNNRVIDVLDKLVFLKYQPKHDIMIVCDEAQAEAFLSSDKTTYWHEISLCKALPSIDTVDLIEIDEYEYKQLKVLNGKTPEEILDEYTFSLINDGVIGGGDL